MAGIFYATAHDCCQFGPVVAARLPLRSAFADHLRITAANSAVRGPLVNGFGSRFQQIANGIVQADDCATLIEGDFIDSVTGTALGLGNGGNDVFIVKQRPGTLMARSTSQMCS